MKRKLLGFSVVLLTLALLGACAQLGLTTPSISDMTSLDKATLAMETYTKMSQDYRTQVAKPNLSAAEKQILGYKYAVLKEAGPKIDDYNKAVRGNLPIDQVLVQWIDAFLTQYRY